MRGILLFFVVISSVYGAKETLSDLYELLKDPALFSEIEKRLGSDFDVDDDLFSDVDGCYDTSGLASADCNFYANGSAIIKTSESVARGAEFLKEYVNISCPRDCTALCCEFPNCDTSVYQDKGDHKCYLFHCGDQSNCVFTQHGDYWTGSISKETHTSHSFAPGGATYSHENELENLGSHNDEIPTPSTVPPPQPTTVKTTTTIATTRTTTAPLYGLGKSCPRYGSNCEDPHAVCLMQTCRCSVGYHEKNGTCRKHCRRDEYECENYSYYSENARECIPTQLVCDGNPDCMDASDENNCRDKTKQDDNKQPPRKPVNENGGNRNNPVGPHPDRVKPVNRPLSTIKHVSTDVPTTAAPVPTQPAQTVRPVGLTDSPIVTPDSLPATNNVKDKEPVSKEDDKSSQNQLTDTSDSENNNNTAPAEEKTASSKKYNILNAESMEVTSYTDSFQGPIVALALGLAITLILLIFVGCRLRTVKRRLRKGRALHSNEADYLINGMYL